MHTSLFALGAAALAATSALAAPSPKYAYMKNSNRKAPNKKQQTASASKYSITDIPGTPKVSAPHKNVWKELSHKEAESVVTFLFKQEALNLTGIDDAGSWDNTIGVIDVATPNKTETLEYLAGKAGPPPRYAYATLHFGAFEEPYVEDYLVGPLPVSNETTYAPYGFRTSKGSSRIRNYDADQDATYDLQRAAATEIDDIIQDLLGYPADDFDIWGIDPLWHEDGKVIQWVTFWGNPTGIADGQTLLPQGLYMRWDITGRDPSKWGLTGWLHADVFYGSTSEFRAAWEAGKVEKTTRNDGMNSTWIGSDKAGPDLPYDDRPPPQMIAPGGQRFAIDDEQQYASWGDFTFYWSYRRDSGMRLWDVKYKNSTILHELGLNEALAHYAGNDPTQSGTAYLDSFYGFGPYGYELAPGYDCPTSAHYVSTSYHAGETTTTHKRSLCFFESDLGFPISRHTNRDYIAVSKNIVFNMRSVSTIGNYDYTFTYSMDLSGSIHVEVSASGYIQSAYYAYNGNYGYQIQDGLAGSMHDHVLNWKADFDILGQANTVAFHKVEATEAKYVWSNTTRKTMHLVRSELTNEDDASLEWENGRMVLIYNKNEKNKYGEERAWRIHPTLGNGMKSTIQESSNLGPAISFARHPLYVTQHKDSEFVSSHPLTSYDPYAPNIDFEQYLNGENLEQEDLVLWFNLGMHHVPHTGDLPNTVQNTARAGLVISPHNYLLGDPSRQTSQMVRVNYNSSNVDDIVSEVVTFGGKTSEGLFNLTATQFDFESYENIAEDRILPYNKQKPGVALEDA
ncbi:hypothetical protein JCM10207_003744 [Rhodosporidiobolus poonsookiae]